MLENLLRIQPQEHSKCIHRWWWIVGVVPHVLSKQLDQLSLPLKPLLHVWWYAIVVVIIVA